MIMNAETPAWENQNEVYRLRLPGDAAESNMLYYLALFPNANSRIEMRKAFRGVFDHSIGIIYLPKENKAIVCGDTARMQDCADYITSASNLPEEYIPMLSSALSAIES